MTKVEELRQETIRYMHLALQGKVENELPLVSCLDQTISAAHAEGVAAGAEQESRRWLGAIELAVKEGALGGFVSDALDNASVLAPTKK